MKGRMNSRSDGLDVGLKRPSPKTGMLEAAKSAGAILALLSAVGAYYGFGTALAMASTLGIGVGVWYESLLDLVSLAGFGLMGQFMALTDMPVPEILWTAATWSAVAAGIVLLSWLVLLSYGNVRARVGNLGSVIARLVGIHELHQVPGETRAQIAKRVCSSIWAAALAGGSLFLLLLVGVVLLLALLCYIPLLGYSGGKAYVRLAILEPQSCVAQPGAIFAALKSGQYRSSGRVGATCAEVVSLAGQIQASGRVVVARSGYVIFYRPKEGNTVVVPIKDSVLRSVDVLK